MVTIEDNTDVGRCMHGCYPASIDTIRRIAREDGPKEAEEWIDKQQPNNEPYVGAEGDKKHQRTLKISAGSQGVPIDSYLAILNILEKHHDYDVNKTAEWLFANPGSQLHQEMQQRRQQAEQQINRSLGSISDLYQQKHLLEHDLRKLEQKQEHFANEDQKEEALKADFVDEVDQHTGRASILQMQANNIFPSITADFYSMKSLDDLKDGGHLSNLPEQEKAVLRKKWKLYEKWKEKFGGAIDQKVQDLQRRLKSVETSIEQTEQWLKPYIQTIKQMEGDAEAKIEEMNDPYMIEGYSSSVRGLKVIAHKPVRTSENSDGEEVVTHRDVIVIDTSHISLGGSEQPQAPGQGGEVVIMEFKEYTVCDHVFQEVFQPQIEDRTKEVKRFLHSYTGKDVPEELQEHTAKPYDPYKVPFLTQLKNNVLKWFGGGDEYYHPAPSELRATMLGPKFGGPSPVYIELKYEIGLYVMK